MLEYHCKKLMWPGHCGAFRAGRGLRAFVQCVAQYVIKLCPRRAQTCGQPLFCDCDLEINPMTLKLEGDILKMYLHTEDEAPSLRHLKLRA